MPYGMLFHHQTLSCHACQLCQKFVRVLQSAVDVATEWLKLHAQNEQQRQQMLQWLEAEKQQATQLVNAALAEKDAACEEQVKHAWAQAHR